MDPVLHLLLPLLFLLAIGIDKRRAVLFAPFAILPDFDVLFGLHRAALHSFLFVLVLPVAVIVYSRLRRPDWLPWALLAQFYLASHVVLDLGGVAFLWPFVQEQFFLDIEVTLAFRPELHFGYLLDYGMRPLVQVTTTDLISETGFALIFLGALMVVVFRKESVQALRLFWGVLKGLLSNVRK
jgi:membrane-bound metal-dependent hydrolase YbcI (DUF457 family)